MAMRTFKGWKDHPVDKWPDFQRKLEEITYPIAGEEHHFLYRGQADADDPLLPSLVRLLPSCPLTGQAAIAIERSGMKRFVERARTHLRDTGWRESLEVDPIEIWSIMQHYRAPTRLLDWSGSPYVASYFAVNSNAYQPGAIWIVDRLAMHDRMVDTFKRAFNPASPNWFGVDAPPCMHFVKPKYLSERLAIQQGWFSACERFYTDHGQVIALALQKHGHRGNDGWAHRIIIPPHFKQEMLATLQTMNITPDTLFPGLDGLGQSIRDHLYLDGEEAKTTNINGKPIYYRGKDLKYPLYSIIKHRSSRFTCISTTERSLARRPRRRTRA